MSIYIMGDLHLSFGTNKPMNVFGTNWEKHYKIIKKNWLEKVEDNDIIILAGDFSWAMNLDEAKRDFEFINNLPGKKVLIKGNHDYWWTTIKKMDNYIIENGFDKIFFLSNNSYAYEKKVIVGTRGWNIKSEDDSDLKIMNREIIRLENSIIDSIGKYGNEIEKICVMHYPPITQELVEKQSTNGFIDLMIKYGIKQCFYGHLHGNRYSEGFQGNYKGIDFKLISSDHLNFDLYKI